MIEMWRALDLCPSHLCGTIAPPHTPELLPPLVLPTPRSCPRSQCCSTPVLSNLSLAVTCPSSFMTLSPSAVPPPPPGAPTITPLGCNLPLVVFALSPGTLSGRVLEVGEPGLQRWDVGHEQGGLC